MHFCTDEIQALAWAIPFVRDIVFWVKHTWVTHKQTPPNQARATPSTADQTTQKVADRGPAGPPS